VALFGRTGHAQTTTSTTTPLPVTSTQPTSTTSTSTSTSTTTTLLPHAYSPATQVCIDEARIASKHCKDTKTACRAQFQKDFASCFAVGTGVRCATTCIGNQTTCYGRTQVVSRNCRKTCLLTRIRDVRSCKSIAAGGNSWAAGDQGCLQTAYANFDLCRAICAQAVFDCNTTFKFCIADCPNL
jgi:hypothetical protein